MAKLFRKSALFYVVRSACTPSYNRRFTTIIPIPYSGHYNNTLLTLIKLLKNNGISRIKKSYYRTDVDISSNFPFLYTHLSIAGLTAFLSSNTFGPVTP